MTLRTPMPWFPTFVVNDEWHSDCAYEWCLKSSARIVETEVRDVMRTYGEITPELRTMTMTFAKGA